MAKIPHLQQLAGSLLIQYAKDKNGTAQHLKDKSSDILWNDKNQQ